MEKSQLCMCDKGFSAELYRITSYNVCYTKLLRVLLGDNQVGMRQVQAALDLVHVGQAVDPRFAAELDLIGNALMQGQVFLGKINDGLIFEDFKVYVGDLQGGVSYNFV